MEYTKEFKERTELLDELERRGLSISDRDVALDFLVRVGYFRSGAYRYVFREILPPDRVNPALHEYRSDNYIATASFQDIIDLESFDSRLIKVCLDGLLDFEIRLRASIAHVLAARDVAAHMDPVHLDEDQCRSPTRNGTKFSAWTDTCTAAIAAASEDEDFLKHHLEKYPEQPVPVWAITEVLSFGKLPFLYDLMKTDDARTVAREFGFRHPRPFGTVLRAMVDLRNTCAHGSRLFNRVFKRRLAIRHSDLTGSDLDHIVGDGFTDTPKSNQRLYIYAAVLAHMLRSHVSGTRWPLSFRTQVRKLRVAVESPGGGPLLTPSTSMGFPRQWEQLSLWTDQPRRATLV